jgi:adenylate kinase family enzyme
VELDSIHWGPNWTPLPLEVFRERVRQALDADAWVIDGNYSKVRDIVWGRAHTVVWLDYPLSVIMGRVIRRTLHRTLTREELWSGNQERFWEAFFGRDSIVRWSLSTYGRRRKEYPVLFSQPEYAHLNVIRLPSPGATRKWLNGQGTTVNAERRIPSDEYPVSNRQSP